MNLFIALALTIIVEGLAMLALARSWQWVYLSLLCNMLTNPLLNLILAAVFYLTHSQSVYRICIAVGEIAVVAAEAAVYKRLSGQKWSLCSLRSLVTNALSFAVGLLIM